MTKKKLKSLLPNNQKKIRKMNFRFHSTTLGNVTTERKKFCPMEVAKRAISWRLWSLGLILGEGLLC